MRETTSRFGWLRAAVGLSAVAAVALLALGGAPALATPPSPTGDIVLNGGFEAEVLPLPTDFVTRGVESTALTGWAVTGDSIDHVRDYWQPAEGDQSIDLDGNGAGAVSQVLTTTAGRKYDVVFSYAANPDRTVGACGSDDAEMTVRWNGAAVESFSHEPGVDWVEGHVTVTAAGPTDTLTFASEDTTSCPYGIALDAVSVTAAADHFEVSYPATTTAGDAHDVTVTALDPDGNVASGYRGTVQLSSSDPYPASLPAGSTFTSVEQGGPLTFPGQATLYTSGSQSITATDAVDALTGSAAVTVLAASAESLTFEEGAFDGQPVDTKNGAPTYHSCSPPAASATNPCALPPLSAPVAVLARDHYGNPADNPLLPSTVRLSATETSQVLDTQNANAAGVYSFDAPAAVAGGLGTYHLTATVTSGGSGSATSEPFQLVADLTACTGTRCETKAANDKHVAYGRIDGASEFDPSATLLTNQFLGNSIGNCNGAYQQVLSQDTEVRPLPQNGLVLLQPTAVKTTIAIIIPKSTLQSTGYTSRNVNTFQVCTGAQWIGNPPEPASGSAWLAKQSPTSTALVSAVKSGDYFWGWTPDCSNLTAAQRLNGNPCIALRTKNAKQLGGALGLGTAQVAALPFKSGDFAVVVTMAYPWDGRLAGP
jgi:choice-of-anchor C domain-containing protein